jgi:hypothetical protein
MWDGPTESFFLFFFVAGRIQILLCQGVFNVV